MKFFIQVLFLLCFVPGYSQQRDENNFTSRSPLVLVAKNKKHSTTYGNGDNLKIFYYEGANVIKAKGRLFVKDTGEIQLLPFGRKDVVSINRNTIKSVGRWSRNGKIAAAVIGGTGAAAIGLALAMEQPATPGVADANIIGLGLFVYSVIVLWYEIVAIPSLILREVISLRSEKKGYHFYIIPGTENSHKNIFMR